MISVMRFAPAKAPKQTQRICTDQTLHVVLTV